MYSPEDEDERMPRISFGVQSDGDAMRGGKNEEKGSLLGGVKDYFVQKKLNFDNMITKLNEVEERLQREQEIIEKKEDEEWKSAVVSTELQD